MRWTPHNYQLEALSFLITNPKSGLFLDPGLGKTSTSLGAMKILKGADELDGVLMIAPLRVVYGVWGQEIDKWENFKNITYTRLHDKTKSTLWGEPKDIYLINPEGLPWLHGELLKGLSSGKNLPFKTLWIDESTKFKKHDSKRFALLCDMLPLFKRRHIMTGTPSPRSLLDLWSQSYLLDEGASLGSNFYKFRNKYFEANDWNKYSWFLKEGADESIHNAIAPIILDMSASDHIKLPELTFNDVPCTLPEKVMKQYKSLEDDFFAEIDDDEVTAEAAAQKGMKCHQIANGYIYEDIPEDLTEDELRAFKRTRKTLFAHGAKMEALKDLVEELNGKPLLIAYKYKHDLKAIKKALGDVPYIGSGVSPSEVNNLLDRWNEGSIPVLAGHPASMGHGLNMQASGNDICWYSLTWDLEEYLQFNARIYRQGVKGSVRIHHLVSTNTIDEVMLLRLGDKDKEQQNLRDALRLYRRKSV